MTYGYEHEIDVRITNEDGHVTVQDWAAFGDPAEARLVAVTDGDNKRFAYSYNGLGQLTAVWQPGDVQVPSRTWTYVPNTDRVQHETHPESGTTSYTYDGGGAEDETDARGTVSTYSYDQNDRLTAIDVPGEAHDVAFGYNESDHVTLVRNAFAEIEQNFNRLNKLQFRKVRITGQPERAVHYDYDGWGNRTRVTYPSNRVVEYDYDTAGRVTTVWRDRASETKWADVTRYHPSGAIGQLQHGNGIVENFGYHPQRRWLSDIAGGGVTMHYDYTPGGNVGTITDSSAGVGGVRQQTFTYDGVDRLRFITGNWGGNEYRYDALGNRTFKALGGVTTDGVTYHYVSNRLMSIAGDLVESGSYDYDLAGNMFVSPAGTFTYTPFNMVATSTPTGGAITEYRYDGDHQRVARFAAGVTEYFIRDSGGQVLSEFAGEAWRRDYVYLGTRLLATVGGGAATPPSVTTQPRTVMARPGELATLTAAAAGWPVPTVQWQVSLDGVVWTDVPGATVPSYAFTVSATDYRRRFRAVFTNASGVAVSSVARVTQPSDHDFDGDGRADLTVYRPSDGSWLTLLSTLDYNPATPAWYAWGLASDIPLSGTDFDGDGRQDLTTFSPADGMWHIRLSGQSYDVGAAVHFQWGLPGDVPVPGDIDGDGRTDLVVFRPSDGGWYLRVSSLAYSEALSGWYQWGLSNDLPLAADFDGDGRTDLVVYRPSDGGWYMRLSSLGYSAQQVGYHPWGTSTDIPLVADFDGDGRADLCVWRPADGTWNILLSSTAYSWAEVRTYHWGLPTDIPLVRDVDGDGCADLVVFRPADGGWYLRLSSTGYSEELWGYHQWGLPTDIPLRR